MNVILDTNIWVSFLFGKRLHTVSSVFENTEVHVYVSFEQIAELRSVLSRSKIRSHVSAESIEAMWTLMREYAEVIEDYSVVQTDVRDVKDVYLLSMAEAIPADFLVTGDKDLLVLEKHVNTHIITYSNFIQILCVTFAIHNNQTDK